MNIGGMIFSRGEYIGGKGRGKLKPSVEVVGDWGSGFLEFGKDKKAAPEKPGYIGQKGGKVDLLFELEDRKASGPSSIVWFPPGWVQKNVDIGWKEASVPPFGF